MSFDDFKGLTWEVIIHPCPWCKKTGKLVLDPDSEVWLPHVVCQSPNCAMSPKGNCVPIRKTSKRSFFIFKDKVLKSINYWNENNPIKAYEKTVLDLSSISHWFEDIEEWLNEI